MNKDQQTQDPKQAAAQAAAELQQVEDKAQQADVDGLKGKKPEELTQEELRLMADTMPGEGPGD
jgi:hypothetical protein